jgi:outer membrane protein
MKKFGRVSFVVLASFVFGQFAFSATQAAADTLRDAMAKAYRSNPSISSDRARQRSTRELVPQAKALWAPRVTAQASSSLQWSDTNVTNDGTATPLNISIQLSKPLYDGGRNRQQVKQAEANVAAGRQQTLSVEQDVIFRTVQAYMNVVRDRRIMALRSTNVDVLRQQSTATGQRFQVGEVTKTDVEQARARVSAAQAARASAKAQLSASEANYVNLVGQRPGKLVMPSPAKMPASLERALRTAQSINPNVLAAAFVADAATHAIHIVEADLAPQVNFNANFSTTLFPQDGIDRSHSAKAETVVSIPLYEGGRTASQIRAAKETASQRRIEKISAVRTVRENVTTAWNSFVATGEAISSANAQVEATQLALDGVRAEYAVGSRTTIDVLNVEQELVNARISLASAERDRVVVSYQLIAAMGGLTGSKLGF